MKVQILNYRDLTQEEKDDQPNNGVGKEYAAYLRVSDRGRTIALKSDAMEPEDCCFLKDLDWIPGLLKECYELGRSDQRLERENP